MSKVLLLLKKTIKAILWVALVFVILFVIVAGLIQIPAVQNKIVETATSFISDKTHTHVEIKNVSISFPKSVVIEGLYLEDVEKDTLVFMHQAKINIALFDILMNKINVNSLNLDGLNLNLHNTETDSLFNYNFLLTAFKDTTTQIKTTSKTPTPWTFNVNDINLKNIRIRYYDNYGGMNAALTLKSLKLKMDKIDLDNLVFNMDDLLVENLNANLLIKNSSKPKSEKSAGKLPLITANNIQINNSVVNFGDSVSRQSAFADITRLEVKDGSVDLDNEQVTLSKIYLADSKIRYKTVETKPSPKAIQPKTDTLQNSWKVTVKNVELNDNSLAYDVANTPVIQHSFDANHLFFKYFTLDAEDINYSSAKTQATIIKFNAIDKNKFTITAFSTLFSMDHTSITAKNLKASTTGSKINGEVNIQYESLEKLKESLPEMILNVNLKAASIKNSDILYFSPDLAKQDFFKNTTNVTNLSGIITGSVNRMKGRNVSVTTGEKTELKTDFYITGLPNAETALYDFPNLHVISGKKDISMMAGSSLPQSIELPENIDMQVVFKGRMKDFASTIDLNSSFGSGHLVASIDKDENFKANMNIPSFDLGSLMKDKAMYGPVSMNAEVKGHGLDPKTITAKIKATVSQIYLNKYNYHNLTVDGTVNGREFAGKFNLNDKNAVLDFDGLVNLNPNKERYKFNLNVKGVDLLKLNFSKNDLRISFAATADLKGNSMNNLNGKMGIGNMIIAHAGKKYLLDSLLVASINQPQRSEINISSALVGIKYSGTLSPVALPSVLTQFINSYFPISDAKPTKTSTDSTNFKFEIQLHNHPVLSEVFLPELKEFEPGLITGSFDREKQKLLLNGTVNKIVYGSIEIDNLIMNVNTDSTALNYKISTTGIFNSQIKLDNFLFDGRMADNKMSANISSIDKLNKKLLIRSEITKVNTNYKLVLNPKEFYLMNKAWDIAADNYVEFGKQGFLIHHLFMNNATEQINIASVHDKFNDDLNIAIRNFKLEDISQIVEKDSSMLKGNVDGNVLLKRVNNSYGIIADADITNLVFQNIAIGNLVVKADNPTTEKFNIDMRLSGDDNNMTASGYFIPNGGNNSLNIKADIQSLSMKTVQAFSMGQLTESSGTMSGDFSIAGSTTTPEITGQLVFNNAFITPVQLNNRLELKHETVQLKSDGIYFNSFTLLDSNQNKAIIDGKIQMKQFSDFVFGLHVNSKDFLLFNTISTKENNEFYGRMIIDSKIDITGPMSLPVINARVKMKNGSNFTFAVPEDKLTTDKGENVVEFDDSLKLNSILYRSETKTQPKSGFKGFDLSSIIEVDKEATLKLLMDPTSTDSLVVRGEAALSFTMDRSGKMSLTGAYNLNEGSYLVSLESVIKKKFEIVPGSTIIWNGDPMDAIISINATYSVRATPIDLVANQMAGATDADKAGYKQPYPFLVVLKLRGAILQPEITFEIQLPPEDKGILGGAVNQKLVLLNEDPSALNKQVFALLVLGRFVQENPLQSESGSTESLVRSTVGSFLSTQLNRLSSKVLPGVEMNFDIQSYNDFQSGQAQGRTQVEIGVKKQLFDERLSVEVGGKVDVEGAAAKQNSVSDIASDVTVEYKLVKDGTYRLKAFRHNQYEGAIEGQLVETGVGVMFVKDFNRWGKKKPLTPKGEKEKK
ncbi:MAG: hypothetical protein GZ091_14410 [Paludibacter sp.]|nr:hypothetical protein [Paludibacter sp.]